MTSLDSRALRGPRADDYRRGGLWDDSTLSQRVAQHAMRRPTALAVVDRNGEGRHDYAELLDTALRLAGHLREHGVGRADVVSIQLPNQFEAVAAAVAVQALGAVINPLLPGYRVRELAHVFRVAAPRAVLTPAVYRGFDHRPLIAEARKQTGCEAWHVVAGGDEDPAAAGPIDAGCTWSDALDTASRIDDSTGGEATAVSEVIFTSGTEAAPKAVLHTEETTNFSVRIAYDDMRLGSDDVVWMPSPVGHSTGFNYGVRFALYHGLPLVLQDRWSAEQAVALIDRFGCSYTLAATTFLQDLVDYAQTQQRDLAALRCFGCGGAPVPPDLVRAATATGIGVRRLYGSTEVLVATWNRAESSLEQRTDTDGAPLSHVELELRDEDGQPSAPGERGEIFVRGPNTCVGFLDDPEREARTLSPDGWIRSGDLAVLDPDGYLTIAGRSKDIIIRGGLNIAPREIEDLLLGYPEIERAAVVGVPDERLGERACACVVLRAGSSIELETITQRLRASGLATHKLPERLECLESLPTTASGKIQKFRILEQIAERAAEARTRPPDE